MNTTGGATIMGSYPYPPNGIVELDYEFILIFKKLGKDKKPLREIKEKSALTKEEWKEYFNGHWYFGGARQNEHKAMFPDELPKRAIKMFTYVGDTVLDPFLGSGTTTKVAMNLNRNSIGYEINEDFLKLIKKKIGLKESLLNFMDNIQIITREERIEIEEDIDYTPRIKDAKPQIDPNKFNFQNGRLYRVTEIIDEMTLKLNTGLYVRFLGVTIEKSQKTNDYLKKYVLKKEVFLKFDESNKSIIDTNTMEAYVFLKNNIFINTYLIKSGLASADKSKKHRLKIKFLDYEKEKKLSDNNG